jgi:hypothetical protein
VIRNETEIVYATLRDIIFSYPGLKGPPRIVFDYEPSDVVNGSFPCVGIRQVTQTFDKRIDKDKEYTRTEHEGKHYAWYETGRFKQPCTVALFHSATETAPNPLPFLRSWNGYITKEITDKVRFLTVNDPVPGEYVHITPTVGRYEQQAKRLYAVKMTLTVAGKMLSAVELKVPGDGQRTPWKVHQNPDAFKT